MPLGSKFANCQEGFLLHTSREAPERSQEKWNKELLWVQPETK